MNECIPSGDGFHVKFVTVGRVVRRRVRNAVLVDHADAEAVVTERIQIADITAAATDTRAYGLPVAVRAFAHLHLPVHNGQVELFRTAPIRKLMLTVAMTS